MLKDLQKHNESITPNSAFLNELHAKLPEFFTPDEDDENGSLLVKGTFDLAKIQNALIERNIDEFRSGYQHDFIGKDYEQKHVGA